MLSREQHLLQNNDICCLGNKLSASTYEAKRVIYPLGLEVVGTYYVVTRFATALESLWVYYTIKDESASTRIPL
jgi:hypothetical protein